jgi:hypothetical protein
LNSGGNKSNAEFLHRVQELKQILSVGLALIVTLLLFHLEFNLARERAGLGIVGQPVRRIYLFAGQYAPSFFLLLGPLSLLSPAASPSFFLLILVFLVSALSLAALPVTTRGAVVLITRIVLPLLIGDYLHNSALRGQNPSFGSKFQSRRTAGEAARRRLSRLTLRLDVRLCRCYNPRI